MKGLLLLRAQLVVQSGNMNRDAHDCMIASLDVCDGDCSIIELLLPFVKNTRVVLKAAIERGHYKCIPLLFPKAGFSFERFSVPTNAKVLETLVSCGVNVRTILDTGCTLLHYARSSDVVTLLVETYGLDVNARSKTGRTPLMGMCMNNGLYSSVTQTFVEDYLPDLFARTQGLGLEDVYRDDPYLTYTLPRRLCKCKGTVLYVMHVKLGGSRDISRIIAELVWKSRRKPVWD